ncbi:hypothetical protein AAJP47_06525 [Psychrobacter sp. B38]|uniref:hypothetical protein n=1 Tax=Psychrobacter sp. B38 TaxID=3143538 RepID=UPI00320CCEFB
MKSSLKYARAFWLAGILIFVAVLRRELNYLPDLWVPSDFTLLSQSYYWWEDVVLTIIYLTIIGLLVYARRYTWAILKKVPWYLYVSVAILAVLQYMGERAIVIPESIGELVEELSETLIYTIALVYLWRLSLPYYEKKVLNKQRDESNLV